jgi:integrase
MPNRSLTQLFVDRIGPKPIDKEYWDTHLSGFGLRVRKTGAKSWVVMYRVRGGDGRLRRQTLGSVHDIPEVADARKRALASLEKARAKVDPVEEIKAAAEQSRAETRETFAAVAARFLAEHVERNLRPNTIREWKRVIARELIPQWGDRPIRGIDKGDVLKLLMAKAATRPMQADEIRKVLRRLCGWSIGENLLALDPTEGVAKRVKTREERDRVLSDAEIQAFWAACDRSGWPFGPLFKMLLLTAQRREEVGAARWSEFDLERCTWTIPAARAKNKKPHLVHLSAFVRELLEGVPRTGDLLFASRGSAPSGYSRVKARLDGFMAEAMGAAAGSWTLHDLRRTAASGMAELDFAPHVVGRVLNHVSGAIKGIDRIYIRHEFDKERRAALEAWGRRVEGLVRPRGGSVVELHERSATA